MTQFRKKPVVIEATQYTAEVRALRAPNPEGVCQRPSCDSDHPHIHTLEGIMRVTEGDWIITGVKGERYPCKPDIFEATYEPV